MKPVVVIPTYNERENVEAMAAAVLANLPPEGQLLFLDDNSPDGTGEVAADFLSVPRARRHRVLKTSVTALLKNGLPGEDAEETIESKRRALKIDALPPEAPDFMLEQQPRGADRGTAMHKALCSLDPRREIAPQLDLFVERGMLTAEERALIRVSDLAAFFRSDLGRRALAAPSVRREWGFCMMEGDMLVQGVLDLCFQEEGRWILVDYKTDRCPAADLPGLYGDQLRWYARALREITRLPVGEMWLYSLRESRAVKVE